MVADERLYWLGNAAKTRIIAEIMARPGPLTILDYGAGNGGDWPDILRARPDFKLVCYEPYEPSVQTLKARLRGLAAEVYGGNSISDLAIQADVIINFSVLGYVYERAGFFENIRRCLAPNGICYLNYDDGRFRPKLDLNAPDAWFARLKEHALNLSAGLWESLGQQRWHQRRASLAEVEGLAAGAKLAVRSTRYENLASLKALAKTIAPDKQQAYARFWIDAETRLNAEFAETGAVLMGDPTNLWRETLTRTTVLVHAR